MSRFLLEGVCCYFRKSMDVANEVFGRTGVILCLTRPKRPLTQARVDSFNSFRKFRISVAMTCNEIVGLDKNYMFGRGQLNKHF